MITLVCGLGRCGSSLVMQMLQSGGMDNTGAPDTDWPGYEDPRVFKETDKAKVWLEEYHGRAVKWLNPNLVKPPKGLDLRVIWIDRDAKEQGKSWHQYMVKVARSDPKLLKKPSEITHDIIMNRKKAIRAVDEIAKRVLFLQFEDLIEHPRQEAEKIQEFLYDIALDIEPMVRMVQARGYKCTETPMEHALIRMGPPPWITSQSADTDKGPTSGPEA